MSEPRLQCPECEEPEPEVLQIEDRYVRVKLHTHMAISSRGMVDVLDAGETGYDELLERSDEVKYECQNCLFETEDADDFLTTEPEDDDDV